MWRSNRLKLVAASRLPSWRAFYRFFGAADDAANVAAYRPADRAASRPAEPRLLGEPRPAQLGRRRISIFARNLYRHGVLGRFIGVAHALCPALRRRPARPSERAVARRAARASSRPRWRRCSTSPLVRWATANRLSLYGLGIPPAQYEALAGGARHGRGAARQRLERLACDFSLDDNYFAWQAFGRRYAATGRGRCRPTCGASTSTPCARGSIASRC